MARKVALITGAGGGLGSAAAEALIRDGVAVVGTGRRPEPLWALKERLAAKGEIATLAQDMTLADAPREAIDFAVATFGRLDFLVNNAGPGYPKPVIDTTDEMLDLFINGHLRAPFRFAREAYSRMEEGGAIVNISSIAALRGRPGMGIYSAVKAALVGLTQQLACEFVTRRIRCNAIAPGVIATEMSAGRMTTTTFRRMMIETVPNEPSVGKPEHIGDAVAYLCSASAQFINGHTLVIDGGWSTTHYLNPEALGR
jgi:meso-butanediol dehydrogenase / (S,S)-butanediol dehydrogenase / diacetyl reductase